MGWLKNSGSSRAADLFDLRRLRASRLCTACRKVAGSVRRACPACANCALQAWPIRARRFLTAGFLIAAVVIGAIAPAAAQDSEPGDPLPTRDLWGEAGILDMPNARIAQDGMISATLGLMQNTQRYNFAFSVTPWFEAVFRYGHISGTGNFFDYHRNLGFKLRLLDETDYFPVISIGARDVIGTGRQGAEYLVASKQIGDFDFTAGFGWGRLADNETFTNPIALVFPSFKTRSIAPVTGGTPAFGQLFHGEHMGVFGGVAWRTPIDDLTFLAEYSSDKYTTEESEGVMKVRAPVNVGLSYKIFSNLRLMAGWFYGTSYGFTLTYAKDPTRNSAVARIGPAVPPPHVRTDLQQEQAMSLLLGRQETTQRVSENVPWEQLSDREKAKLSLAQALMSETRGVRDFDVEQHTLLVDATYYESPDAQCHGYARIAAVSGADVESVALTDPNDVTGAVAICNVDRADGAELIDARAPQAAPGYQDRIRTDVAAQQLEVVTISSGPSDLYVYYRNNRYWNESEAAGRIVRILSRDAPPDIEVFHVVLVQHGLAVREFRVIRSAVERTTVAGGQASELGDAVALNLPSVAQPVLNQALAEQEPHISWAIAPSIKESFFDPRSPLQIQLLVTATADLELAPGVDLVGGVDLNVYNNYDVRAPSASVLPHVRSDVAQYWKHGINGINGLELDYRSRLAPDVYSLVRVGYLEDMYGGVGGQILWRPDGQRFAIGADLYQVWKRDFDRLFGFQSYHILTGHISVYYASPWYGLNFNVHAGRYLAGDYGGTIEITRKFETGVELGAFATFTNVPFSKFGEGSFDKGFILRIPLEWALPFYTRSQHYTIIHSLARDGGQRLLNDDSLYEDTRSASYGEILPNIDAITDP